MQCFQCTPWPRARAPIECALAPPFLSCEPPVSTTHNTSAEENAIPIAKYTQTRFQLKHQQPIDGNMNADNQSACNYISELHILSHTPPHTSSCSRLSSASRSRCSRSRRSLFLSSSSSFSRRAFSSASLRAISLRSCCCAKRACGGAKKNVRREIESGRTKTI